MGALMGRVELQFRAGLSGTRLYRTGLLGVELWGMGLCKVGFFWGAGFYRTGQGRVRRWMGALWKGCIVKRCIGGRVHRGGRVHWGEGCVVG